MFSIGQTINWRLQIFRNKKKKVKWIRIRLRIFRIYSFIRMIITNERIRTNTYYQSISNSCAALDYWILSILRSVDTLLLFSLQNSFIILMIASATFSYWNHWFWLQFKWSKESNFCYLWRKVNDIYMWMFGTRNRSKDKIQVTKKFNSCSSFFHFLYLNDPKWSHIWTK